MSMPRFSSVLAPSLLAFALAACHGQDATPTAATNGANAGDSDTALPKPDAAGGPVTGMPSKPGPGPIGPPVASSVENPEVATVGADGEPIPSGASVEGVDTAGTNTGTTGTAAGNAGVPEPTLDDAVAVVRGYYAALAAHDAARAHAYWVQGTLPSAEGNDPDTVSLTADIGAPGRMDAAAGSRYVRIPVTLTRTLRDGSTTRGTAVVTLRRAVVDGATPEQRAWRIAFVELAPAPTP